MASPKAMLITAILVTVEVKDSAPAPANRLDIYLEMFTRLLKLQVNGLSLAVSWAGRNSRAEDAGFFRSTGSGKLVACSLNNCILRLKIGTNFDLRCA